MSRRVPVPDIAKVALPQGRQAIPHVHAYLRERILDGTLVPGTKFSQVSLAEQLGVSRTPLREVLRMLQEEGLVQTEPNQRTRVSALDPRELDEIYASRMVLESLAVSVTVPQFDADIDARATTHLDAMAAVTASETEAWFEAHSAFHRAITCGMSESTQKQLGQLADQCLRYIRIYQQGERVGAHRDGDREHEQILGSLRAGSASGARSRMAQHLARTALQVLTDVAPEYRPVAVPTALQMLLIVD